MCKLLGIDKTRTTAFHPTGDGLIERAHRSIEDMLSKYIQKDQRNWDEVLPLILMAYRSSKQESINMTPCMMMLGREIDLPVDLLYPPPPTENDLPSDEYVVRLQNHMKNVHELARSSLLEASMKQKRLYDSRISKHKYSVGDAVWLREYTKPRGLSRKLQLRWDGPFKIIRKISDLNFKIQRGPKSMCKIVHFNRLKPFKGKLTAWFRSQWDIPRILISMISRLPSSGSTIVLTVSSYLSYMWDIKRISLFFSIEKKWGIFKIWITCTLMFDMYVI